MTAPCCWAAVLRRPILTDLAFYNRIHLRLLRHLHRLLVCVDCCWALQHTTPYIA